MTAARVHEEIACLALFDPGELADVHTLADLKKLPAHVRRAVTGWRYDKDGRLQFETAKPKALKMLGRSLGMFRDRTDVTVGTTLEDLVARAGGRNDPTADGQLD